MVTPHLPPSTDAPLRVAYQGEPGAYSEAAAAEVFTTDTSTSSPSSPPTFVPCTSFSAVFAALTSGRADRAVLPIENSLAGTIHENLDLLLCHPRLCVVGELDFRVRHCLLALPGVALSQVRDVYSHPMALAQCDSFIRSQGLDRHIAYDTAGSAKLLAKDAKEAERDPSVRQRAAIASKGAARIYGLQLLAEGIEDNRTNFTRFLVLTVRSPQNGNNRTFAPFVPGVPAKTSIAFCLIDSPGILCRALSVFAVTNIDLSKIESRQIHSVRNAVALTNAETDADARVAFDDDVKQQRWRYVFFVDIDRHADEKSVSAALNHLQEITTFYTLLGTYPSHNSLPEPESPPIRTAASPSLPPPTRQLT